MEEMKNIQWPGWETVRLIGRGSYGAVYEIERDLFGKKEKAALKHIRIPQNPSDIEEMYSDGYDDESITTAFQSHLESIVAEYSLMRKLNGAANVVNCDDVKYIQHEDGIGWDIYIKMELLTPLTKALSDPIPEETVIKIAEDMCQALSLCRRFDIVHRDIKPQNIFVSPLGDYKLGDFGIAKTVEKTMGGTKTGTYKYMAPEVYNNQPYGHQADIYSLGLVLYWMLNKKRMPFMPLPPAKLGAGMDEQARNRRLSGEQLPPPTDGIEELKRIVLKACAYAPKERYHTANEMLEDLEALSGKHAASAPVPEPEADESDRDDRTLAPDREEETVGAFGASSVAGSSFASAVEPEEEATVGAFNSRKESDYGAASSFGNRLGTNNASFSAKQGVQEASAPNVHPEKKGKKRSAGVIAAIAACLVLLIGGIFLLMNRDQGDSNSGLQSGQKETSSVGNANAGQKNTENKETDLAITETTEPEPKKPLIVDQVEGDSGPIMAALDVFYHDKALYYVINPQASNATIYSCESLDAPAKRIFSSNVIAHVSAVDDRLFFACQPGRNGAYVIASIKVDGSDYYELTARTENITLPHYSYGWIYAFDYDLGCTVRFRTDGSERQVISSVYRAEAFANGYIYHTTEDSVMRYDPELQSSQEVVHLDGLSSITICSVFQNRMLLLGEGSHGRQLYVATEKDVVTTELNSRGYLLNGLLVGYSRYYLYQLNPDTFEITTTVDLPVSVPDENDYARVVPLMNCVVISSVSENGNEAEELYVVSTDGTLKATLKGQ